MWTMVAAIVIAWIVIQLLPAVLIFAAGMLCAAWSLLVAAFMPFAKWLERLTDGKPA